MTPWIQQGFKEDEVALFRKIEIAVQRLPDLDLGTWPDKRTLTCCHVLARATGRVFNLPFQDGYFYPNCAHTWLLTPSDHIIDVYPVGMMGGPLFIRNTRHWSPGKWLYRPTLTEELSEIYSFEHPCFERAIVMTVEAMQKVQKEFL